MPGYTGPRPWLQGTAAYNTAPNNAPYPSRTQGLNPVKPQGQTAFGVDDAIAIAGILASIGGTIYSNRQQHKLQNEYMEKQQQYAKENWQMENEYNLPANVKNRLMAAGLNPNLMYGQGAASGQGGTIDPVASPEAYFANPMQGVPSMISSLQEAQLTQSQIAVNESVAKKNNADAGYTDIQKSNSIKRLDADIDRYFHMNQLDDKQRELFEQQKEVFLKQISLMESEIDLNKANEWLTDARTAFTIEQSDHYADLVGAQIADYYARAGLSRAQAAKANAEWRHEIRSFSAKLDNLLKEGQLTDTKIDQIRKETGRIIQKTLMDMPEQLKSQLIARGYNESEVDYYIFAFFDIWQKIVGQFLSPLTGLFSFSFGRFSSSSTRIKQPSGDTYDYNDGWYGGTD